jgi:hypothetical protein
LSVAALLYVVAQPLERYPDPIIAQSLRIHLATLLRAMVDGGV